ncbi:unnamed protein product [Phyllotreta striolata]|uniref:Peroxinectin n=1 Tax=Phyllotreta striolata TaxID=444603 RepID=A0A9N9TNX3_PHYSR|nr:unnamed protein product [Phyllotreta striolata]
MHKILLLLILIIIHKSSEHVLTKKSIFGGNEKLDKSSKDSLIGTCKTGSKCVPFISCPGHIWHENKELCSTTVSNTGICCTTGKNISMTNASKERVNYNLHLDSETIGVIKQRTKNSMSQLQAKEAQLLAAGGSVVLTRDSASYGHFRNSRRFSRFDSYEVTDAASRALEMSLATKAFKDREGLSNLDLEQGLLMDDLSSTPLGHSCATRPQCPVVVEKYRSIDGSCNNRYYALWGTAMSPMSRLMAPSYDDGIWSPRRSVVDNELLPSARRVVTTVFTEESAVQPEFTLLLMQFGQFISHDISQGLDFTYGNGSAISCCNKDGTKSLPIDSRHFACMPIYLPKTDSFYAGYNQRCMNFVRTVLAPREDCTLGYSQQMNKVTHFLDGSTIYGSSADQTAQLRTFEGGKLKTFNDYGRELLPLAKNKDACLSNEEGMACFESGDTRTNQMITLVALHTLFLREHNRIADVLSHLNPTWDDEYVFLEARQIVVAEIQAITYKEFLPAILGYKTMQEFDLNLENGYDYYLGYDSYINPSIINEFSTAAFRFGHSIVDGRLELYEGRKMDQTIFIPEVMFYPSQMRRTKFLDMILSTLTGKPMQAVDRSFSEALTKYLFRGGSPFGVDLPSINIQRGRDHGLRPYNDYRQLSGLPRYNSFEDFGSEVGEKLAKVYRSVDDVDLWVGGLLEEPIEDSLVGPVFRDMIAEQFLRTKRGDRYYFENDPSVNPGHFSPDQLFQLRKASISRIICDNNDHILISRLAPNAFRVPNVNGNDFVDCHSNSIPRVDLRYWNYA